MSLTQTRAASPPISGLALRSGLAGGSLAGIELKTSAWTRRSTIFAFASIVTVCAAAYLTWISTGTVVPWDSKNQFYAMFRFLAGAMQHGEFPLWNPYHYGGYPAIADPQSLLTTPSMVLFALLAPRASMQLFDAVILAHLCFGGLCVVAFFRHRRWHAAAAVLAALIFMLGGSASGRLQHTGMIISYAFFPAALLALDMTLERASYRFAILFAFFASLMVIGRDQVAFLMAFALAGRALSAFLKSDDRLVYGIRRLGPLALAGVLIAAAIFVPVLLTLQFLSLSNRPGIPFGAAAAGSLNPANLVTAFVPNFFGSLDWNYNYWGPGSGTPNPPDWTDRSIDYLFAGTLPMVLVIWHGVANGRVFASGGRYFLALFLAALVYAVGRYTPVFGFIFDHMPGAALYRRPADATFLINIALAFLSGHLLHLYIVEGLPRALHGRKALPHLMSRGVALFALAGILGSGLAFSSRSGRLAASLAQTGIAIAVAASVVGLLIAMRHKSTRAFAASLLVALSGGELLWRNAASSLNAEPFERYSVYAHMRPDDAAGLAVLRKALDADRREGKRPRVEILGLDGPWQNASMVLKLEDTLGYNPLRIAAYERAVGPGENAQDVTVRQFPDSFQGYGCRLAALLGLEYLVLDRPLSQMPPSFPRPAASAIYTSKTMYIYKLGIIAPRAYFATRVEPADTQSALAAQVMPAFDWRTEALIDESRFAAVAAAMKAAPQMPDTRARTAPKADIVRYGDTEIVIKSESNRAGVVVLHDIDYPGWVVRVDGTKKPLLRTNLLFRGVEVPAGHHRVEFSFQPLSFANFSAFGRSLLEKRVESQAMKRAATRMAVRKLMLRPTL